jgi:Tol biopolymer transport system component
MQATGLRPRPRYDIAMRAITLTMVVLVIVAIASLLSLSPAYANGYEIYPYPAAWARDSSMVAVCLPTEFNGSSAGGTLQVYDRFGRLRLERRDAVYSSPAFHPRGGRLAVVADGALLEIDVLSGETRVLVDGGVLDCAWYRRGGENRLAYSVGQRFGSADIFVMFEDGESVQLTETGDGAACIAPMPSPGANILVFTRMPGREGDYGYERLWVFYDEVSAMPYKAANEQRREWDYHESNAVFPFDDWIIFQRGGWGDWNLYRLDLKTGKEYLELTDAQQPSVSDGGQYLAFTRRDYEIKLGTEYDWEIDPAVWLWDRGTNAMRRVSTPGRVAQYPAVAPDGERLAWVEENLQGRLIVMIRGTTHLMGQLDQ